MIEFANQTTIAESIGLPVYASSGWLCWNDNDSAADAVWNADNPLNNLAGNSDYRMNAWRARDTCLL